HECTIVRVDTQYDENSPQFFSTEDDEEYKCELHPEDRANAGSYFVKIEGVDTAELASAESGETTMMAEGATIMNGVLSVPSGAAVNFARPTTRRRLATTIGTRKVLVVRAETSGGDTIGSKAAISDRIFGTHGNTITMRSQYLGCSHNQLDFVPFEGTAENGYQVTDGVIEVDINRSFRGDDRYEIEDAMEAAAEGVVGDLEKQFDNVILCVPPGTSGGWIAYAYEMGHNLNLAHSGTDQGPYYDKHGMMGYSYDEFNSPKMCFNPAKSWYLGWFADQSTSWNPNDGTWVGTLVGDVDYDNEAYPDSTVLVKLETGRSTDLYVGFNRATGYNSQTKMSPNMVTIVEQGTGYSQSTYIAGLSPGQTHTISSFGTSGKTLVIDYMGQGRTADLANVAIYYTDCVYDSCCEGPLCPSQDTPAPTPLPTASPTSSPTTSPTISPTSSPTASPTISPTANPTVSPTMGPSDGFVTAIPSVAPTPEPTPEPSLEPTQEPTPNSTSLMLVGTGTPQLLLSEDFRNGNLGQFANFGDTVEYQQEDGIGVARFEMKKGADKSPRINTIVDLQGENIISIFFWFKALFLENDQSIVVRYSIDGKQTWTLAKEIQAGDGQQYDFGVWYRVTDIFFPVPAGTSEMVVQVLGRTGTEMPLDAMPADGDKSEFVVAGFAVLGDSPITTRGSG
ncbi:MAG: hypothetical protein SGILL_006524, partial [Bacillariaceae sp.]